VTETFFIRTEGGPHPGTRVVDSDQFPWPLPGILNDSGGKYIKMSESNLEPQEKDSPVKRSARYEWRTDEQIAQNVRLSGAASQGR
jgi:hypothetical protein